MALPEAIDEKDEEKEVPAISKIDVIEVSSSDTGSDVQPLLPRHHISSLKDPLRRLNDEIVNAYFSMIVDRASEHQQSLPSVFMFPSQFFVKLESGDRRKWHRGPSALTPSTKIWC